MWPFAGDGYSFVSFLRATRFYCILLSLLLLFGLSSFATTSTTPTNKHHCSATTCDRSQCQTLSSADNCSMITLDRCRCCAICVRKLHDSCTAEYFVEKQRENIELADRNSVNAIIVASSEQIRDNNIDGICEPGLLCLNSSSSGDDKICTDPYKMTEEERRRKEQRGNVDDAEKSCDEKDLKVWYGCMLDLKNGCRCQTLTSCEQPVVAFQYDTEATCTNDWIKLKAMLRERCLKAKCDVVFQPKCPEDSVLAMAEVPEPPDCCQKPGHCRCNLEICNRYLPKCPSDYDMIRIEKGNINKPGSCCDMYKCMPPVLDCSLSHCPPVVEKQCPDDSYRPTNQTASPTSACCPVEDPCVCQPGVCKPVTCPEGFHLEMVRKGTGLPGSCCDSFECVPIISVELLRCEHSGAVYGTGDVWYPTPCYECKCKSGLVFCKKHECPESNECSLLKVPEGECCPICTGCTSENGDLHNMTEQWKKDECTTCECEIGGKILCHKQMCVTDCDNPTKVPGQCCPVCEKPVIITLPFVCPSIELCSLRCEHGMKRDHRGCFVCECNADQRFLWNNTLEDTKIESGNCPYWDETLCARRCSHGYERDQHGCALCKCKGCPTMHQCYKSCLFGFQTNVLGCTICKCKSQSAFSASPSSVVATPQLNQKETETPEYPSCQTFTTNHDHGEWWFDGCRYCFCDRGREFCSVLSCPPAECDNPKFDETGCCQSCEGSSANASNHNRLVCHAPGSGRNFVEGEYWALDNCVECTCHIGHVLCHRRPCRPTPCAKPKLLPGQCCPVCDRGDSSHLNIQKNDSHCTVGHVAYSSGSMWKRNICTSCICTDGNVNCFDESCHQTDCTDRLLHLKDSCCPICAGDFTEKLCRYKDTAYSVGEHWRDGLCRNCTCNENSEVLCTQFECPKCPENSTHLAGQCCPVCDMSNRNWYFKTTRDTPVLSGNYDQTQHLTVVMILCSVGLLAILFVMVLIFCWWRKRAVRHHSNSSSSSRSEPILGGYRFHERQTMLKGGGGVGDDRHLDGKKNGTLISPYDSDGASTGLTSEGV